MTYLLKSQQIRSVDVIAYCIAIVWTWACFCTLLLICQTITVYVTSFAEKCAVQFIHEFRGSWGLQNKMEQCMGLKKKIEFGHKLEELVSGPKILQVNNDAVIHNGHAEIHCLLYHSPNPTFRDKQSFSPMLWSTQKKRNRYMWCQIDIKITAQREQQDKKEEFKPYIHCVWWQTCSSKLSNTAGLKWWQNQPHKFYTKYMGEHIQPTVSKEKEI